MDAVQMVKSAEAEQRIAKLRSKLGTRIEYRLSDGRRAFGRLVDFYREMEIAVIATATGKRRAVEFEDVLV